MAKGWRNALGISCSILAVSTIILGLTLLDPKALLGIQQKNLRESQLDNLWVECQRSKARNVDTRKART